MPKVRAGTATAKPLGDGLFQVDATFLNDGMIPTRTQRAADKKLGSPDRATIAGVEAVVSGGVVDPTTDRVAAPDVRRPAELRLPTGIDGDGAVRVRWIVRGAGKATITYRAEKGGTATSDVELR